MEWNKNFILFLLIFIFTLSAYGNDSEYVIVSFRDKDLSQQDWSKLYSSSSIERRARQGLEFDYHDYPVQSKYIQNIIDSGFIVVDSSKWLNAALVLLPCKNQDEIFNLSNFSFVKSVNFLGGKYKVEHYNIPVDSSYKEEVGILNSLAIKSIGLDTLHEEGYLGENITIAVVDAGFKELNHLKRFKHLYHYQIQV